MLGPKAVRFWQYNAAGQLLGGPTQVNQQATLGVAGLAYNGAGELHVIWNEGNSDFSPTGHVLMRRFSHAGAPLDAEPQLVSSATKQPAPSSIDANAAGAVVVSWNRDFILTAPVLDALARVYSPAIPADREFMPAYASHAVDGQSGDFASDIAIDAAGNTLVGWLRYDRTPASADQFGQIVVRRFDLHNQPLSAETAVDGALYPSSLVGLEMADDGTSVAVFIAADDPLNVATTHSLWARRIDASGAPLGSLIRLDSASSTNPITAAMSADAQGNFELASV